MILDPRFRGEKRLGESFAVWSRCLIFAVSIDESNASHHRRRRPCALNCSRRIFEPIPDIGWDERRQFSPDAGVIVVEPIALFFRE